MERRVAMRVLIAVHGHGPAGWAGELSRALPSLSDAVLRVLVVLDVPTPPFTSLIPPARRLHQAALASWRRLEDDRTRPSLDELLAVLPKGVEVIRASASHADPGRTSADHADEWRADLVALGTHTPQFLSRRLSGAVHERVVRHATCAVLVAPPPVVAAAGRKQTWSVAPGTANHERPAVAGGARA
ncbi:MAG: universal stress protein [Candidatus Rokubacteria bacterium]|nr:universal stress protein [Candidatus Rokubacteria bacterium]